MGGSKPHSRLWSTHDTPCKSGGVRARGHPPHDEIPVQRVHKKCRQLVSIRQEGVSNKTGKPVWPATAPATQGKHRIHKS